MRVRQAHGDFIGPAVRLEFFEDQAGHGWQDFHQLPSRRFRPVPPLDCTTDWRKNSGGKISSRMWSGSTLKRA